MNKGPTVLPENLYIGPNGLSEALAAIKSCLRSYLENDKAGWQKKAQTLNKDLQENPPKDLTELKQRLEVFCPKLRVKVKQWLGFEGSSNLKQDLEKILARLPSEPQIEEYEKQLALKIQQLKIQSLEKKLVQEKAPAPAFNTLPNSSGTPEAEVVVERKPSPLRISIDLSTDTSDEKEEKPFSLKDPATWDDDPKTWSEQQKSTFQKLFG